MKVNILPNNPADLTLLCDIKLNQETLPEYIEVTKDVNGQPFSFNKILVVTDIESRVSYGLTNINDQRDEQGFETPNGIKGKVVSFIIITTEEYGFILNDRRNQAQFYLRGETGPRGAVNYNPQPNIRKIKYPWNYIKSGTFLKIWGFD